MKNTLLITLFSALFILSCTPDDETTPISNPPTNDTTTVSIDTMKMDSLITDTIISDTISKPITSLINDSIIKSLLQGKWTQTISGDDADLLVFDRINGKNIYQERWDYAGTHHYNLGGEGRLLYYSGTFDVVNGKLLTKIIYRINVANGDTVTHTFPDRNFLITRYEKLTIDSLILDHFYFERMPYFKVEN